MNGIAEIIGAFTVICIFIFIANAVFFFANLKLYTEILKSKDQRGRKGDG